MDAPRISLPHFSLVGNPVSRTMALAKQAGFVGVEILITPFTRRRLNHYREIASRLGLALHLHQAWSIEEGARHLHNRVLDAIGYLPKIGYALSEHIPATALEPVVVYADRWREAHGHPNWWLQSVSTLGDDGSFRLGYDEFVATVRDLRAPVVFDTEHVLEYAQGRLGVEHLPRDRHRLLELLKRAWGALGGFAREIHLNDADPHRGHDHGRNLFPGDGFLPLKEFCALVKRDGWRGTWVPEVSPRYLFPYRLGRLIELYERVVELIS